jgi:hypothetical protein
MKPKTKGNKHMPRDTYAAHYAQLVGKTVKAVVRDGKGWDATYGLEMASGEIAWILCDPEGNGPGFLEIQEVAA